MGTDKNIKLHIVTDIKNIMLILRSITRNCSRNVHTSAALLGKKRDDRAKREKYKRKQRLARAGDHTEAILMQSNSISEPPTAVTASDDVVKRPQAARHCV